MSSTSTTPIDVREIPPQDRHSLIFRAFDALQPGQALQLVNDHAPRPLFSQFEVRRAGAFEWTYLQAGPDLWRVQIGKVAGDVVQPREDPCCSGGAWCS